MAVTETAALMPITPAISAVAYLPVAAVSVAAVGALAVALAGESRTRLRDAVSIATCTAVFALLAAMFGPVYRGIEHAGQQFTGVLATFSAIGPSGVSFRVDPTALIIALATAFVWLLATIFGTSYMRGEHARTRFDAFMLLTLAGNIGVLLAGDYLTLFAFFEVMAIASFILVIHGQNPQSMQAGRLYLYMSVIGGLVLLGGVMTLAAFTGTTNIVPLGDRLAELPPWLSLAIPMAILVGFATKAGMFFLHVWLPEAHPVAPSPASALLSGLMVKVGVYGILRTSTILLIPGGEAGGQQMQTVGLVLILGAVATMIVGMVNASFCSNCKELLAYSTISQVGFIVLGIGCAAYLGAEAALAITAVIMFVLAHAAFKATLFLSMGAVIWRTREQRFSRLGGMAYRMPATAIAALVATASIIGFPGTAGFAAKSLMHHAVLEVVHESALGHGGVPTWPFLLVDAAFIAVAAGTFAYATRMFILVFLGKVPEHLRGVKPESTAMRLSYLPLVAFLLLVGVFPTKFIEWFIGPALAYYGLDVSGHAYHMVFDPATGVSGLAILYDPSRFAPFTTPAATENILGVAGSVFLAGTFFLVGHKIGVFDMPLPHWLSLSLWYRRATAALAAKVSKAASALDAAWDTIVWTVAVDMWLPSRRVAEPVPPAIVESGARALGRVAVASAVADRVLDRVLSGAMVEAWLSEREDVSQGAPGVPPLSLVNVRSWAAQAVPYVAPALATVMSTASTMSPDAPSRPTAETAEPRPLPPEANLVYRQTRDWLMLAWRIALFIIGAALVWVVISIATGGVVLP